MPNEQTKHDLPKVLVFSGQGSPYFQMGELQFDGNSVLRQLLLKMDHAGPHLALCGGSVNGGHFVGRN